MEVRRKKGSKFPEIDVFADVYVRPGDELTESFHRLRWRRVSRSFRSPPPSFPRTRQSSLWIPLRMWGFTSLQRRWTRLSIGGQGHIVEGWEMPGGRRVKRLHPHSRRARLQL